MFFPTPFLLTAPLASPWTGEVAGVSFFFLLARRSWPPPGRGRWPRNGRRGWPPDKGEALATHEAQPGLRPLQGFALRRVPFCPRKKEPKTRRGLGAEELQAPRTRFRSKRLHPRTPVFTGAQDRMPCRIPSGAEVTRTVRYPCAAAADARRDRTACGPRWCAWRGMGHGSSAGPRQAGSSVMPSR